MKNSLHINILIRSRTSLVALLFVLMISLFACQNHVDKLDKSITNKVVYDKISDDSLLTLVEYQSFQYFWDGAEPVSGMARERFHVDNKYPENDKNVVTTGGTGFGIMAIVVAMDRGFITRLQGLERISHIVKFLKMADRFHGAWPHWLNGETGKVKPFSPKDNGADLVETAYLVQGLITARQYFNSGIETEKSLALSIDSLCTSVEWNWFTQGGQDVLYWHWSPEYQWAMNMPIKGYNECLITYVLAASSPQHSINPGVYHEGWARGGKMKGTHEAFGHTLALNHDGNTTYGGPLFWTHYSYLGLDPRQLSDQYANYWDENVNQTLINRQWCVDNPLKYPDYGEQCWGLTSSYSPGGYVAHAPGSETDLGVISPTAALSSFPYTPDYSMQALKYFYYEKGDQLWGEYGFYDAFSEQDHWYPKRYLAIDQGPIVCMIENYRTALLWNLFMSAPEVQTGLQKLGFNQY
ncbi:MAG: glucoamylase family protein [Bacteroidales bacterium]|nr:glucoamylase family protein [Bacteroidales bacterium]